MVPHMFDSIGRDLDEAGLRRSATSAAINSAALALALAGTVAAGWWTVQPRTARQPDLVQFELVLMEQPNGTEALEAPPPPGDAEGVGSDAVAAAPAAPAAQPTADTPPDPAAPPSEPPASAVSSTAPAAASPQRGLADGITGLLGRATAERASTTPVQIPASSARTGSERGVATTESKPDMRWRRTNEPDWPPFAKGYAEGAEERCHAHMVLDPIGEPATIEVDGCPRLFAEETRRALQTWRAWPAEGPPIQRATDIIVRFRQL